MRHARHTHGTRNGCRSSSRSGKKVGFMGLERKVEREYEKKGVSKATAMKWAAGTAAKVKREKMAKRGF